MRRSLSIAWACGATLVAGVARAEAIDVVPFASIDVGPRYSDQPRGFDELVAGPGAVRDGDPKTAWIVPGDAGAILLDWSGWGIAPFSIDALRVDLDPPDAALTIEGGADLGALGALSPTVARDGAGVTMTFAKAVRALRIAAPGGTKIASIRATASPGGTIDAPTATCDDAGVHLSFGAHRVLAAKVTRGAVSIVRRRLDGTPITDASVRFDPRPSTYSYTVTPLGSDAPAQTVSVTCTGAARARPTGGVHGVIEGFYGRPWTWDERAKVVRAMGALGMDTYFYAPKDDPQHRDSWRTPYDAAAIARFAALADLARTVGVNVVYGISPGQDIEPAKPADVDALVGKIAAMAKAGIRDAALLMDDLDAAAHPHGAALGAAHAALAATLLASMTARDPASRLWFVPTVYSGLAPKLAAEDAAYLGALSMLPAAVAFAWTGDGVFSQTLKLDDVTAFAAVASRAAHDVWIWDNYPVNDVALFRSLYARPITGRETLLPGSGGLVSNPMKHALASIPAIASYAELARDPAAYATARASGAPLGDADLALVLADADAPPRALADFFAELVHHDTIWPDDFASPGLTKAIASYRAAQPGSAMHAAALDLATRLARLAVADVDLRRDLDDQALSDEIDAYARVTAVAVRAALGAMTGDRAERLGDASSAAALRARAACDFAAADERTWRTIQRALAPLVTAAATNCDAGDALASPDARYARVGEAWRLQLADAQSDANAEWALVGPDGATIADGAIAWTPARLGRFRFVAIRAGDAGAAARAFDVVVVETIPEGSSASSGCGCVATGARAPLPALALPIALFVLRTFARRRRS